MTPDPFARPPRKNQNNPAMQRPNSAVQRPNQAVQQPQRGGGGGGRNNNGGGNRGGSGNRGGNPNVPEPSPWLDPDNAPPEIHAEASFIEYLRWMRPPDCPEKDGTKLQLLQQAGYGNLDPYLDRRTQQTQRLADPEACFSVTCTWRLRVGGIRGPEDILLPAFDARGVPYVPGSTLRGVARAEAIRQAGKDAAEKVFGALDIDVADRAGKVTFLDAYPKPGQDGLSLDMANNIWRWTDSDLEYHPNPNPFFSLEKPTLTIGLRLSSHCTDRAVLLQVKEWLIAGLQAGLGSQLNSGYGEMLTPGERTEPVDEIIRVAFELQGQLIHGRQDFTEWWWDGKYKLRTSPHAEVRPTAFKNMLRYWFRVFARGVLKLDTVQRLEGLLFGSIKPTRSWGCLKFEILNGKSDEDEDIPQQTGKLVISKTLKFHALSEKSQQAITDLIQHLTWITFHIGGIGQGARRPLHSRNNRPYKRGCQLTAIDGQKTVKWTASKSVHEFTQQLEDKLRMFYETINYLSNDEIDELLDIRDYRHWTEAADRQCSIVVCFKERRGNKPFSLAKLHEIARANGQGYNYELCGGKIDREIRPSPVCIKNTDYYQCIITFSADNPTRKGYIDQLKKEATSLQEIDLASLLP